MTIICDIGGTYARFAQVINNTPAHLAKYKVSDYKSYADVLAQYCDEQSIPNNGTLHIATAGHCENGIWKITNNKSWSIDPRALKILGWDVPLIMNDFEAGTYSLPIQEKSDLRILKQTKPEHKTLCLLGPGTGLGLGYYHAQGFVQQTHGGHMPITAITKDQRNALEAFQTQKQKPVVFEDFVSGQNDFAKTNPKLFHEFLGLFAAQSIIHGHAYGGVYLTGGVIEGLMNEDKFDFETFEKWMCFDAVDCVKDALSQTPIFYITDPYPALKGLIHAKSLSDN